MTTEPTKETNYTIPAIILSLVIVASAAYFGKFWYDTLFKKDLPGQVQGGQTEEPVDSVPVAAAIPKSDKPSVELFVMSFCPYGNLAENTMLPVQQLLGDKIDLAVHYIVGIQDDQVNSLHGQPETDQNIRELCVLKNYDKSKMWAFMTYVNDNCGSDGSCWQTGADSLGIDTAKIDECFTNEGFALMSEEASKIVEYDVTASPTLFINDVRDSSKENKLGNPEAYKDLICSAFNEAPEECLTELEPTAAASGGSCN